MNDIVVVDNDGLLGMQSLSGDAYLYPGLHRVRVDFFDSESSHGIILSDSGPATVLRHGPLDSTLVNKCVAQAGSCVVHVDNLTLGPQCPGQGAHNRARFPSSHARASLRPPLTGESSDDVDKLRQRAREVLLEGAKSGKLFDLLANCCSLLGSKDHASLPSV